jgi:hypothetical protein
MLKPADLWKIARSSALFPAAFTCKSCETDEIEYGEYPENAGFRSV